MLYSAYIQEPIWYQSHKDPGTVLPRQVSQNVVIRAPPFKDITSHDARNNWIIIFKCLVTSVKITDSIEFSKVYRVTA